MTQPASDRPNESPTTDPDEIAKFSAMAAEWWDPKGKFAPLHKFNPVRLNFIKEKTCARFDLDSKAERPFEGLRILDVGCGGGLLCEPLSRLGAHVTGIDMAAKNIQTASIHAEQMGLQIDYRHTSVEALAETGADDFDLVLNMEVVEHVADVDLFLKTSMRMVRPNGMMIVATLNRTAKAFALAIVGAEYVLGWLPRGTHQFEKFVRPDEIKSALATEGVSLDPPYGVSYNPLADRWSLSSDASVNYMMVAYRD